MTPEHQKILEEVSEKSEALVRKTSKWVKGIIKYRQKNDNNNDSNSTNETAQELKSASIVIGARRAGFFQQDSQDSKNTKENLSAIDEGCDEALEETMEINTLINDRGLTPTPGGTAATGEM